MIHHGSSQYGNLPSPARLVLNSGGRVVMVSCYCSRDHKFNICLNSPSAPRSFTCIKVFRDSDWRVESSRADSNHAVSWLPVENGVSSPYKVFRFRWASDSFLADSRDWDLIPSMQNLFLLSALFYFSTWPLQSSLHLISLCRGSSRRRRLPSYTSCWEHVSLGLWGLKWLLTDHWVRPKILALIQWQ